MGQNFHGCLQDGRAGFVSCAIGSTATGTALGRIGWCKTFDNVRGCRMVETASDRQSVRGPSGRYLKGEA